MNLLILLAVIATVPLAPALTLPALIAWALVGWLGRTIDEPAAVAVAESSGLGCVGIMLLIVFVGGLAMLILFGGAAVIGGRL